jgi:hypothetical protein
MILGQAAESVKRPARLKSGRELLVVGDPCAAVFLFFDNKVSSMLWSLLPIDVELNDIPSKLITY